jgi:hypothetical protein
MFLEILWSVFPCLISFTINNIMSVEQISKKKFIFSSRRGAVRCLFFQSNFTWSWTVFRSNFKKTAWSLFQETFVSKPSIQVATNFLCFKPQNLQFSGPPVCVETVRFCNCFCETGYNCYNGWDYLNYHEIKAIITWTLLIVNILKQLLIIPSNNIKNVRDKGDFPASIQIFIVISNIIENVSLDSIGRFFLFMGQFRFWQDTL